jgi:hypothetical protein
MAVEGTPLTGGAGSEWFGSLATSAGMGDGLISSGVPAGAKLDRGMKGRLMSASRSGVSKLRLT